MYIEPPGFPVDFSDKKCVLRPHLRQLLRLHQCLDGANRTSELNHVECSEYIYMEQSAIPQLRSHDSRTKTTRFHNQSPTIPQPNSHDSTTKISGFHNQTLRIPRFFGKTTATYFHYTRFLTSYKAFKNHPPPQNNRSNLSLQQAAPLLWEDYRYLLSLYKILDKLQGI